MRMSNEQKIDILLKSFNELKDKFWGNGDNIAEIIEKHSNMIKIPPLICGLTYSPPTTNT